MLISYQLGNVMREALDRTRCSQERSYEAGFASSDLCSVICKKKDCNAWKTCCRPKFTFKCLMIWIVKPDFHIGICEYNFKKSCVFSRVPYNGLIMLYFLPTQWRMSRVSIWAGISASICIVGIWLKSIYWLLLLLFSFIWCICVPSPDTLMLNTGINWAAKLTSTICKQVWTKMTVVLYISKKAHLSSFSA